MTDDRQPHRVIVAFDVMPEGADLDKILDAIEAADDAVIGAADLLTIDMGDKPTQIKLTLRVPSRHDPAELHRQRDPFCTCNDCQQHEIDQAEQAEQTITPAGWRSVDTSTDDDTERAIAQAEQAIEEGQSRWSETGTTRKPTR